MHEMIHWAVGARLPVVLGNINRAMGPPWTIWTDQNDSLSQRDTGILQFYCESIQEILDTVVQAFKVSETVYLPSMIVLDAFVLSHTSENCDIPDVELVDKFLPPYKTKYKMDWREPHAFGGLTTPDWYYELRYKIEGAMEQAREEVKKADRKFQEMFGRSYGLVEPYQCEDAELIIVASGTISGTTRLVVDELRNQGKKVGLLRTAG